MSNEHRQLTLAPTSTAEAANRMVYPGLSGGDLLDCRYRLIDRVGSGGMSVVWRARDELLGRLVAVKLLGAELGGDDTFRDLVRREAWATARAKHPAVATVYDYGEVVTDDGLVRAFVVMEMLDGAPLSAHLRTGRLPWHEAVTICAEIAEALATAHANGVVHRDITPENVMVTSVGLRLFDFGIAAEVGEPDDDGSGSTFGTPTYVAPERLDGLPAQTATDVYSLGVLLFECLTGSSPFPEDSWDATAAREPRKPPRLPDVPGLPAVVARLCRRCLAFRPLDRPTAKEVAHRLRSYTRPWWQRQRGWAGGAVAAMVVMTTLIGYLFAEAISPTPELTGADESASAPSAHGTYLDSAAVEAIDAPTEQPSRTPAASATSLSGHLSAPAGDPLDQLRRILDAAVTSGAITQDDVISSLRQQVDAIAARPGPDALPMIDELRRDVIARMHQCCIPTTVGQRLLTALDNLQVAWQKK